MTDIDTIIAGAGIGAVLALLLVVIALVLLGVAIAKTAVRHAATDICDDDGTGHCTGCTEIGDNAIALVAEPGDAEIEQWVSDWKRGNRG